MKKTTIALLTAAAMGTSAFAVADEHGATVSGDIRINNATGNTDTLTDQRVRLVISGTGEATTGAETFYYLRLRGDSHTVPVNSKTQEGLNNAGEDYDDEATLDDGVVRDYGYFGLRGEAGQVSVGFDDDLIYKFAGAETSDFRTQLPGDGGVGNTAAGFFTYATGFDFWAHPSIQGEVNVANVTLAGYVDTSEGDGIERVQGAASVDLNPLTLSAVYSQRDTTNNAEDQEVYVSGGYDAGLFDVGAYVGYTENDTNPVSISVTAPITDNFSAAVGYGNNDNGLEDSMIQGILNLGGGLDVFANARSGDAEDQLIVGSQYTF